MRHEIQKISKIVDELTTMFLKEDTNEVDFKIIRGPEQTIIRIVDYETRFSDANIEHLRKILNNQRQLEVEEYYWQLAGANDEEDELTLVSNMIDTATVIKQDGNLMIELIRKNV